MSSSKIKFRRNKSKTKVYACYALRMPNLFEIDEAWVIDQLKTEGLNDYIIIKENIRQLILVVNNTEEGAGKIQVASSIDAKVIINVVDKMSATMSIIPPKGGRLVSLDNVKKALSEKGLRHGFLLDAIRLAIVTGKAKDVTIVKAERPVNGKDAQFVCTLPEIKIHTKNSDFKDQGDVTLVEQGEPIMRRIPATPGSLSKNIFGEPLSPVPGINTPFSSSLSGVVVSDDDPNLLIASESGQPVVVKNGISIGKTISLNKIDLTTGNIIFEGSVIVNGDVGSGMIVHARQDITVKGQVENAILDAGGNILIRGAIAGKADKPTETTALRANGSITAKFIEHAFIKSNNSIYAQDWVLASDLTAFNDIVVGSDNSSKGQITGGVLVAGLLVKAIKLGASSQIKTSIEVGLSSNINSNIATVDSNQQTQEKVLTEIQKKIAALAHNPNRFGQEMLQEAKQAFVSVEKSIAKFQAERALMMDEKTRTENAKIVVEKKVYAGVTAIISGKDVTFNTDAGKRTLCVKNDKLLHLFS